MLLGYSRINDYINGISREDKRKSETMKRIKLICTLTCISVFCMAGCSENSESLSEQDIQNMIDEKVDEKAAQIKDDILSEVDSKITNTEFMSEDEKNELINEIMASIDTGDKNSDSDTTIVKYPTNKYYTIQKGNVYNEGENNNTYVTEEIYISDTVETDNTPDKIVDGTDIEVRVDLPVTYKLSDDFSITITDVIVKSYNYQAEPYIENKYPYYIDISVSGDIIYHPTSTNIVEYNYPSFPVMMVLNPYGTKISVPKSFSLQKDTSSFNVSGKIKTNMIPEYITLDEQQDKYDASISVQVGSGEPGENTPDGWVSTDGYYHRSSYCWGNHEMTGEVMTWSEAKEQGYLPCPDCKPE